MLIWPKARVSRHGPRFRTASSSTTAPIRFRSERPADGAKVLRQLAFAFQ